MKVNTYNLEEFTKLIYSNGGLPCDPTVFERIRFLNYSDCGYGQSVIRPQYFVLSEDDKVIGIAKIGYYSMDSKHEMEYSIPFISIDRKYRGKGYSHLLCDMIFKYAKENDLTIKTSTYTFIGYQRVKNLFNKYARKYGVLFVDKTNESLIDNESFYNENMIHRSEMTESELENFNL